MTQLLTASEIGLYLRGQFDLERRIDQLLLGDSYAGSCQGGDQPVPRGRWTMEGWIAAEHLVAAIPDVMNADAVIVEDDPVCAFGVFR